jgi:hypothetical protein
MKMQSSTSSSPTVKMMFIRALNMMFGPSTPNGNKKLDAAFRDAEAKAIEKSNKYPIFLFFSVS